MRAHPLTAALAIIGIFAPALALAGDTEWRRFVIPSTGTSVDMPVSIFTSDAGAPESGTGRRFFFTRKSFHLAVEPSTRARCEWPDCLDLSVGA